ncbi:MAG: hypothetical protein KGQ50_03035 [Bacteroidetes bacterium]|nr:hypothetical protein [Bacteroidota bacterium]
MENRKGTFGYDLQFLKQYHKDLILLGDGSDAGAQIIILPAYQGRVMTSTADGNGGMSFGWINYDLIDSNKDQEHFHAFGGEERFWLGPEGGQFSIFFKKGDPFDFDHWYVPKAIDTEPFILVSSSKTEANFQREMYLKNYSGFEFNLRVNRHIRLLSKTEIPLLLGFPLPENLHVVGFESNNSITNTGNTPWTKEKGLLSIWILSMFNAGNKTTIAVPYKQGNENDLGKLVTDDYFGKVPVDRLKIKNGIIFLNADANYRSKIGISPKRALPILASFDQVNEVLTIAQFSLSEFPADYVNSLWEIQENPFEGDVVNAYNDGFIDGKQMGKFYELESSSPAATLNVGESMHHVHRTIHLKGNSNELNEVTKTLLGIHLSEFSI